MSLAERKGRLRERCHTIGHFFRSSLAIKNAEDNGPTKKDPAASELLCDGEQ